MNFTAYVFVTKNGQYYGDRTTGSTKPGERANCLYDDFEKAMLFSSEEAAIVYRKKIINTNVSSLMCLMPIKVEFTKSEWFKAVLAHF